jgi:hypothetical protein
MITRRDGIVLREAVAADADEVLALVSQRLGSDDVPEAEVPFRAVTGPDGTGDGQYLVAVDDDRIVAVLALWRERMRIGEVEVPAGQIDFVATASDHERRGIVRELVDLAHERAAARGDLLQILVGIPYFYRQFGYTYAIPIPDPVDVPATAELPVPAGLLARRAAVDDLPAMQRLHDTVQGEFDIAMPHGAAAWRWLLDVSTVEMRVVEDDDRVCGVARSKRRTGGSDDEAAPRITVAEVAATSIGVARALLADARKTHGDGDIRVIDRPGTAVSALLAEVGRRNDERDEYLVRIADPVGFLDALRPTLSARLAASPFARESGQLLLSFYRYGAVLSYADGVVTSVRPVAGIQLPVAAGGAGVPPDLIAALLFGPHGALQLEAWHPDCNLGRRRALVATFFPPVTADMLTYYVA